MNRGFRLIGLQAGLPRLHGRADATEPMDREWFSGFAKDAASGPLRAGREGLEGDGQADRKNHGGPDKALCVYPMEHHDFWIAEIGPDFGPGAFGENFTVAGALEADVCLGDVFQIGKIVVEISQPRQPCWKLARRWRVKDLALQVERTGRTGWYLRVLQDGLVGAPADAVLLRRPHPEWTVERANEIMHHRKEDRTAAGELAACPALSASWRDSLGRRAHTGNIAPSAARRHGPDA